MDSFGILSGQFVPFLLSDMRNLRVTSVSKGMPTAEVLTSLVLENETISAIFVFAYRHPPLLQQRVTLTSDEKEIIEKAKALRGASRLPFWEALMLSCFDETRDFTRLLQEALFHQSHAESLLRISREEVLAGRLAALVDSQAAGNHLSVSSRIELAGEEMLQLRLLDFHCPESAENDRLVSNVCSQLFGSKTLVFSSGESYHALGVEPVNEHVFRDFLTRSLLFAPIVDARYVAHQLLEGACALRLSKSVDKPTHPRLKLIIESVSDN